MVAIVHKIKLQQTNFLDNFLFIYLSKSFDELLVYFFFISSFLFNFTFPLGLPLPQQEQQQMEFIVHPNYKHR